jgi:thiol-disulfide isomerase/thioredoxin
MLEIELLSSPDCKPCEVVKRLLHDVLEEVEGEIDGVNVKEVDVIENPDIVLRYGILTTPALAINGELSFVGVPKRSELLREILKRAQVR